MSTKEHKLVFTIISIITLILVIVLPTKISIYFSFVFILTFGFYGILRMTLKLSIGEFLLKNHLDFLKQNRIYYHTVYRFNHINLSGKKNRIMEANEIPAHIKTNIEKLKMFTTLVILSFALVIVSFVLSVI